MESLSRNVSAQADILDRLVDLEFSLLKQPSLWKNSPWRSVMKGVSQNPNTSSLTLEKLTAFGGFNGSDGWETQKFITKHNNVSEVALLNLIEDGDELMSVFVSDCKKSPDSVLRKLAIHESGLVRINVAKHINSSATTLVKAMGSSQGRSYSEDIKIEISKNRNSTAEMLSELAVSKCEEVKEGLAKNSNTPFELLDDLSKSRNEDIKLSVAKNNNTSSSTLEKLSRSKEIRILKAVAKNKNSAESTLNLLAKSKNKDVQKSLPKQYRKS